VTFWAYALFLRGYTQEGWTALRAILPRDAEKSLQRADQFPIYIPNFYRGTPCGRTAGQSSRSPNTGTAAWYYRTVIEGLFGIRAGWDGLTCKPQLPADWQQAPVSVTRRWRGADYHFKFQAKSGLDQPVIHSADGSDVGQLIPQMAPGQSHEYQVISPQC
jgi:cellobionic acid phosphorylase